MTQARDQRRWTNALPRYFAYYNLAWLVLGIPLAKVLPFWIFLNPVFAAYNRYPQAFENVFYAVAPQTSSRLAGLIIIIISAICFSTLMWAGFGLITGALMDLFNGLRQTAVNGNNGNGNAGR
jgi:hypothetical protein